MLARTARIVVAYWRASFSDKGTIYNLRNPVKITVRNLVPLLRYPVTYLQNFNAQPSESTIFTGVLKYEADSTTNVPTCGRSYTDSGEAILYSEGYCCECSLCALLSLCKPLSRANTD